MLHRCLTGKRLAVKYRSLSQRIVVVMVIGELGGVGVVMLEKKELDVMIV